MKLEISTTLQLKEIQIKRFSLEENIDGINKFLLDADFLPVVVEGKDGKSYKGINFTLKINYKAKKPALKADIEILALFEINKNLKEEEQAMYILYNGLSILYGIVRGMIFQACSVLPPFMRLLPTVNIAEFIQVRLKKTEGELK